MLTAILVFLAGVLCGMILYGALVIAAENEPNDAAQ